MQLRFLVILSFLNFGLSIFEVYAQKYKYKDLYPILEAKDYGSGEPGLRKFLQDNPDHPNANLQMAFYYDEFLEDCENALIYYKTALGLIDEKEVSKNEKYYLAYSRRDLRTGKYAVKFTDVQFDIEKRIESCSKSP